MIIAPAEKKHEELEVARLRAIKEKLCVLLLMGALPQLDPSSVLAALGFFAHFLD
jgi:hypothetical protein